MKQQSQKFGLIIIFILMFIGIFSVSAAASIGCFEISNGEIRMWCTLTNAGPTYVNEFYPQAGISNNLGIIMHDDTVFNESASVMGSLLVHGPIIRNHKPTFSGQLELADGRIITIDNGLIMGISGSPDNLSVIPERH